MANLTINNTDFEPCFNSLERGVLLRVLRSAVNQAVDQGGGVSTLDELDDVDATFPQDDDILTFSGGVWIAAPADGGSDNVVTSVVNRTLSPTDHGKYLRLNHGTGISLYIEDEDEESEQYHYPDGMQVEYEQAGAGVATLDWAPEVTVHKFGALAGDTAGQWAVAGLKKVGYNEWTVFGNLV